MTENNLGRIIYILYFSLIIYLFYLIFNSTEQDICGKFFIFCFLGAIGITVFLGMYAVIFDCTEGDIDIIEILIKDIKTIKEQTINIIKFYLNI